MPVGAHQAMLGHHVQRFAGQLLGLLSATVLILMGCAFPALSQGAGGDNSGFVGLPGPSTIIGPLHRTPDHGIVPDRPAVSGRSTIAVRSGVVERPSTITTNVANAPGWQRATTYTTGDRVIAGPGYAVTRGNCTPTNGTCTNGQPIYLWALTGGSRGNSADSGNGPQTCGSPAGVGGIPTGWWSKASTASDNTLTWTCLVKVDYVTLTSALADDATHWAPNAATCTGIGQAGCYYEHQYVVNAGVAWQQTAKPSGAPYQCTSTTSGKGPTSGVGPIADGTCTWQNVGFIPYASGVTPWSHQTIQSSKSTYNTNNPRYDF